MSVTEMKNLQVRIHMRILFQKAKAIFLNQCQVPGKEKAGETALRNIQNHKSLGEQHVA